MASWRSVPGAPAPRRPSWGARPSTWPIGRKSPSSWWVTAAPPPPSGDPQLSRQSSQAMTSAPYRPHRSHLPIFRQNGPVIVTQTVPEHLRWQAESCAQLGSPLYAHLLARAADDVEAGGPIARVIGERQATNASALGLRLMGSVHRLVLQGEAPDLAGTYPSAGGRPDPDAA